MTKHLDTNVVIAALNGDERVKQRWMAAMPDVAVSSVVFGELLFGMRNSTRVTDNLRRLHSILAEVPVIAYDEFTAEHYSGIRLDLTKKGRPCSDADMMIAATVFADDATLVTHNTRHFEPITGLELEDWLTD